MKNNYQCNFNGVRMGGGSIEHPLSIHSASIGTRWKPRGMQLICTLVLLFTFAIGQMWGDETFTFSWSSSGSQGYCYSQAGPTSGKLLTNNAIYFVSNSAPAVTEISNKKYLNPYKAGFVFKPTQDVILSINLGQNKKARIFTISVDTLHNTVYNAFAAVPGSAKMPAEILATASGNTEKQWWLDNTNGKVIKKSGGNYVAGTDGGSVQWLSGEVSPNSQTTSKFGNREIGNNDVAAIVTTAFDADNKFADFAITAGTANYLFRAGVAYRVYILPNSSSNGALKSFTFTPASSTLTLNPVGGTFDVTGWTDNNNGTWSKTVTNGNVTLPTVTKEHYHGGWNVSGNTVTSVNVSANTTVSADWAIDTYTVNFLNKDASVFNTVENVAWNTTVSAPASDPTADGFNFDGWDFDFATPITANTNIASKWQDAGKTYHTVTLNFDNGSANGSESVEDGTAFTQPENPVKEGHTFSKWINATSEEDYDFTASVTGDITLKAIYTVNKYTVNFLNQDASVFSAVENVEWNTAVSAPTSNPSVDHYTFNGWDFDFATPITANTNIASKWIIEKFAVTFDAAGGSAIADQDVDYNSVIAAPASARTNWTLEGWTLDPTADPVVLYDFATPITSALDFTAVWSRSAVSPSTTEIVISNGTTVNTGGTLSVAVSPSLSTQNNGVKFGGNITTGTSSPTRYISFTIPEGKTATVKTITVSSNSVIIRNDIDGVTLNDHVYYKSDDTENYNKTLTAGTYYLGRAVGSNTIMTYSSVNLSTPPLYVKFMNGETKIDSITVTSGEKLGNLFLDGELPVLPDVTGYTFNGWNNGSDAVDKDTEISASMTLTADWTVNTHTLTWDFAEGGSTTSTDYTAGGIVAYGTAITYPSANTMSRELYDFAGWSTSVTSMPDEDLTIIAQWTPEKPKHNITYVDLKGADNSANPTKYAEETGVAEFAPLADVEGFHFIGWSPASIASTATTDQTITAQWVPTVTVTYSLGYTTEEVAPTEGIKLEGDEFTLAAAPSREYFTFMGWLCDADNAIKAAGDAYTMTATNTTFTAQWLPVEELTDTYIWSKNTSYGGDDKCISSSAANANDPTHLHTSVAYSGFTNMGRASDDNTECELTISVTRAGYGIKSICTYGKFEESAGGSISWDGGVNWTSIAKYTTQKDTTFVAPDGTYPTSFKIKFFGVSAGTGGLWWRNALVTLEAEKTITGTAEELVGAKINGTALTDEQFAGLLSSGAFNDANTYGVAPVVTFVKQVTTSYEGLWPNLVENVEVPVEASDNMTNWEAVGTVNSIDYTVTLAMPTDPVLETETTALTLTSAKIATDSKQFTFSGRNLANDVTISLASEVEGLTVYPTVVSPDANGRITDQVVTVTYASLEDVAEANVLLTVMYSNEVKKEITLTYSSTKGYMVMEDVTGSTTWDWTGDVDVTINDVANKGLILANYIEGANFEKIEGKEGERARRNQNGGCYQGTYLHFNTTVYGKVKFYFRAPSSGDNCTIYVNNNGKRMNVGNRGNSFGWSKEVIVKGDVVVELVKDGGGETRVQQIVFTEMTPGYSRNVTNNIGTLCVDHNVLAGGAVGATFYQIASRNELYDYKIDFEEVLPNEELKAGEPYIFQSTTGRIDLFYGTTAVEDSVVVRGMHGVLHGGNLEITTDNMMDVYYIQDNKLRDCSNLSNLTLVANRAYIVMSEVPTYAEYQEAQQSQQGNAPARRRVTLGKDAEQIATGFENINAGDKPMKLMINGQIFILRGEKVFDATGRLVK